MPINTFLKQYPFFKVQGCILEMICLVLSVCSKSSSRSAMVLFMGFDQHFN